jgi:hypothetical protein
LRYSVVDMQRLELGGPCRRTLLDATLGVGRNSFSNPGTQYWNIGAEKDIPATWLHVERGSFAFKVQAQNFTNHDNIGPPDIKLLDIGTPIT